VVGQLVGANISPEGGVSALDLGGWSVGGWPVGRREYFAGGRCIGAGFERVVGGWSALKTYIHNPVLLPYQFSPITTADPLILSDAAPFPSTTRIPLYIGNGI
jgi:hypothetical protein